MERQVGTTDRHPVFRCLADGRRRDLLRVLLERTGAVGLQELATHVVAETEDKPLFGVGRFETENLYPGLVHDHLPKLAAAGLVEWDREERTVEATDHPALSDPKLRRMLREDGEEWDEVLAAIAIERRRIVLARLAESEGPVDRADLAEAVRARDRDGVEGTGVEDEEGERTDPVEVEVVLADLHHVHLPKLDDAGLVEYDVGAGTASYRGHPSLPDEWLDSRPDESPRAILPAARDADDVWTIEGREDVIARGQSLFEQADEELFLMFTTDGLLEDGCVRRLRDAIDGGVDVYVGSQTPGVRDLVRDRVPGATIWEPQMDWLNLPPKYEKVGRLVLSDRNAVMLATLGDETAAGRHRETAITGAGENNPVVVLLRELLGSRLDHLDAQSEDFRSEIPP